MEVKEVNYKSGKIRWPLIIGGFILFVILKSCMADPSDAFSAEQLSNLETYALSGYGPEWAQLSDDEKLAIADMTLKKYEKSGHVDLDVDADDIVQWMEDTDYKDRGTQNIIATINNYLFMEAVKEGKLDDILSQ